MYFIFHVFYNLAFDKYDVETFVIKCNLLSDFFIQLQPLTKLLPWKNNSMFSTDDFKVFRYYNFVMKCIDIKTSVELNKILKHKEIIIIAFNLAVKYWESLIKSIKQMYCQLVEQILNFVGYYFYQ